MTFSFSINSAKPINSPAFPGSRTIIQKTAQTPANLLFAGWNSTWGEKSDTDAFVAGSGSNYSSRATTPSLTSLITSTDTIPTTISAELGQAGILPESLSISTENPFESATTTPNHSATNSPQHRNQILQPTPIRPISWLDAHPSTDKPEDETTNHHTVAPVALADQSSRGVNPPAFSFSKPPTPFKIPFSQVGEHLVAFLEKNPDNGQPQ